ncbi:hypothetical protein ScPMuIL_006625 [Solemya velum]
MNQISEMDRESLKVMIELSDEAERYDDMHEAVRQLVKIGHLLDEEERNLLSIAYKNVIGRRRAASRILDEILQEEMNRTRNNTRKPSRRIVDLYSPQMEAEMEELCEELLEIMAGLIPLAENADDIESQVFYQKMRGDCFRYMAEISSDDERRARVKESALATYIKASELARDLSPTDPLSLGLALNFSVFYYDIMKKPVVARDMAKKAFETAIVESDELMIGETIRDFFFIIQLMRDNITMWSKERSSHRYNVSAYSSIIVTSWSPLTILSETNMCKNYQRTPYI